MWDYVSVATDKPQHGESKMSLENAILELAASMRYLADSNRRDLAGSAMLISKSEPTPLEEEGGEVANDIPMTETPAVQAAIKRFAKICEEGEKALENGGTAQEFLKATADNRKAADSVAEKRKFREEPEKDGTAAEVEAESGERAPLDYAKDVRPVLLAAIKKAGKGAVQSILGQYGVEKADKLDPKDYAAVLAAAQKLAE
jgi:hypothetical protein